MRQTSFVLDGEAVRLGVDGISDFEGLDSRRHNDEVQFYAFDLLVSDGEDVRKLPASRPTLSNGQVSARFLSNEYNDESGATAPVRRFRLPPVAADLIQRPDARAVSINGRFTGSIWVYPIHKPLIREQTIDVHSTLQQRWGRCSDTSTARKSSTATSRKDRRCTHPGRENSGRSVDASFEPFFEVLSSKLLVVLPPVS
jgi:hypothetical protein